MTSKELATEHAAMFVQRYRKVAKPTLRSLSDILDCWLIVHRRSEQGGRQYIMDVTQVLSDMTNSVILEVKKKSPND